MADIFSITVSSNYAELWRYNIAIVAACFDEENNQVDVVAERSQLADVGANLSSAEQGWMERNKLMLKTPKCAAIESIIYLIPHSLPSVREIDDAQPFEVKIVIKRGNTAVHNQVHTVNQWSGASISLKA